MSLISKIDLSLLIDTSDRFSDCLFSSVTDFASDLDRLREL